MQAMISPNWDAKVKSGYCSNLGHCNPGECKFHIQSKIRRIENLVRDMKERPQRYELVFCNRGYPINPDFAWTLTIRNYASPDEHHSYHRLLPPGQSWAKDVLDKFISIDYRMNGDVDLVLEFSLDRILGESLDKNKDDFFFPLHIVDKVTQKPMLPEMQRNRHGYCAFKLMIASRCFEDFFQNKLRP